MIQKNIVELEKILKAEYLLGTYLTDEEFKSIGLKIVQMRKIKGFIEQNKDKFGEKNIQKLFQFILTQMK